jgi:hypothetical protein
MGQLYGCTPANGVWVVPGTHKLRRVDIRAMAEAAGSDRLPTRCRSSARRRRRDHQPAGRPRLVREHQPDWRITLNFGFHRRRSVLGVQGGGIHAAPAVLDAARIRERARSSAMHRRAPQALPERAIVRLQAACDEGFATCGTMRRAPA